MGAVIDDLDSNGYKLTLFGAERDDEGVYSCIATNDAGEDVKNFNLSVYRK